jgi:hypothetical protein
MPLTPGLEIPYGIQPVNAVPVDTWSGPYEGANEAAAIAAANAAIPEGVRFQSLEVRLIIAGTPYKYWYKNGTSDSDLVLVVPSATLETNRLFVSKHGNDSNSGSTISESLLTIKKAAAIAAANAPTRYTIFVSSGDYTEQNPVFLNSNVSLIGDNLRRTNILPANPQYDILWCSNSVYVWGFTFRNHLEPSAAAAFPNLTNAALTAIAFNTAGNEITAPTTKPFIVTSPYIQGCSSITSGTGGLSAGCGIRVDGSLAAGYLRSFVTDSFTQFNQGGKGIHITNDGYAQLVSTFTICCTEGVIADNGGTCSINTSNCSFGLSGLVAVGYSSAPVLTGTLAVTTDGTDTISVSAITPRTYPTYSLPVDRPYLGLVFKITGDDTLYTIDSVTSTDVINYKYSIAATNRLTAGLSAGATVSFYIRSTITSSSHTMEYVGSGVELVTAVPALGGVGNPDLEAVASGGGAVYWTSTNQEGDFKVGAGFKVVQSTGTIEGETFNRSILSLVTPLTLALE